MITSDDLRRAVGAGWNLPKGDKYAPQKQHREEWMAALDGLTVNERQLIISDVASARKGAI